MRRILRDLTFGDSSADELGEVKRIRGTSLRMMRQRAKARTKAEAKGNHSEAKGNHSKAKAKRVEKERERAKAKEKRDSHQSTITEDTTRAFLVQRSCIP